MRIDKLKTTLPRIGAAALSIGCLVMLFTAFAYGGISIFPLRYVAGIGGTGKDSGVFLRDRSPEMFYLLAAAYLFLALLCAWYSLRRQRPVTRSAGGSNT